MPKQGVHVGPVIEAPHLDSPIVRPAEELMRPLPEGKSRHRIPVAGEGLHKGPWGEGRRRFRNPMHTGIE